MIGSKSISSLLSAIVVCSITFIVGCSAAPNATGTPSPTPTPTPTSVNEWTWMGGSDAVNNATGVYGSLGVASASNIPSPRSTAMNWTDASGNLWLFGGMGTNGVMNDLWEFNPSTKQWTWVGGSSTADSAAVYGSKGVAAAANVPSARTNGVSWVDAKGNLWLFGGSGQSINTSNLNDLWEFSTATKQWTWIGGDSTVDAKGVYGTQGVAATGNVPGARLYSVGWTDTGGNLWLFGGEGFDSTGAWGSLNDLWEFNPTTQQWTWVGGSTTVNASAVYGSQGVAASTNVPGSRSGSVSWTDASSNLWLFGGTSAKGFTSDLNDLWEFNISTKEWVWVSGSNTSGQVVAGDYGTKGVAAAGNVPGSRCWSTSWTDTSGNLWLFGGQGYDSTGTVNGNLNDLWKFNISTKQWTWVSGSNTIPSGKEGQPGVYGTLGVASATNAPGGKVSAVTWVDTSGNVWLFGGDTFDSVGNDGALNDLWQYQP